MLGVDLVNEEQLDKILPKRKKTKREKLDEALGPDAAGVDVAELVATGDAKMEDLEAPPVWEANPAADSPVDISSRYAQTSCLCRSRRPSPFFFAYQDRLYARSWLHVIGLDGVCVSWGGGGADEVVLVVSFFAFFVAVFACLARFQRTSRPSTCVLLSRRL